MQNAIAYPQKPDYKQHRGRFMIPESWIFNRNAPLSRERFEHTVNLFKDMIIVKCEYDLCSQVFDFKGG